MEDGQGWPLFGPVAQWGTGLLMRVRIPPGPLELIHMERSPTQKEIAEACQRVQEEWTKEEREQRAGYWRPSLILQRAKRLGGHRWSAESSDHRYHGNGEW